jgi:hypothetical protein
MPAHRPPNPFLAARAEVKRQKRKGTSIALFTFGVFGFIFHALLASLPIQAAPESLPSAPTAGKRVFLPLVIMPAPASPFGFDLRADTSDTVLPYVRDAKPKWVRVGDALWSRIEPVRGAGYRWENMTAVEANIRRLREMGIEPLLVVQQSPAWAQRVPGRLCSPPKPEYADDFAHFMAALVERYANGPLQVNYYEIWNEPDFAPADVSDEQGAGCWADAALRYHGGAYYGEVVKRVAVAVKAANPTAVLLGGALMYRWPDDTISRSFLSGMLAAGAGSSIDALSFHAYGEWGAGDLLIAKTIRIREVLATFGLDQEPLFATEIAATCRSDSTSSCPPNFEVWKIRQANYAARIYAEAIALQLKGALWYTLSSRNPGFAFSHLIDEVDGKLTQRPAYYAFRNSARLLSGARYIGPPVREPPPEQTHTVQVLTFRKARSTLHVLWVPQTDFPKIFNLPVAPGARAICTDHLSDAAPAVYLCSDTNGDGTIPRAVNELPQYVEVFQ